MTETGRCPYCGAVSPSADAARQPAEGGFEPLYREMRRIREIAEERTAGDAERRIADLTRQVQELRATVARLRGPGAAARPVPASARG